MRYCTVVRDIRALARARVLDRSQALGHFPAPIGTATSGSNTITNHSSHISTLGATGEDGELANSESSISGSGSATSWQQISKSAEPESDYHSPRSEKRRNLRTSFKLARSGSSNSSNSKLLERERRHSELVLPHAANNNNNSDSHPGHESSDGAVVEHSADGTVKVTLQGGQYSIELTEGLVADARLAESISACVNAVAKKAAQQHRKSDTSLGSRTSRIGAFIFS